ncbi:NosR/NirI family protein [Marinobacterium sp. D7]|uniref:transcriptional regulator NosR n=1 Tax=Marinobacterium ramblicola TaxID=2849041 RepID=UPI001C2DB2DA|nr:NosR/NirI family protein [Marinobacterium ramblicola]MBV1790325.1 NosR/NirI family protein [Marinobacterium ramblicola]
MRFLNLSLTAGWLLLLLVVPAAQALTISAARPALPAIDAAFPEASRIGDKTPIGGDEGPQVRTVYRVDQVLGYAYETADVLAVPAYSGEPVNMLVALDPEGRFVDIQVLEHHEPILLVGIPEQKLFDFTDQYRGLRVGDRVRVGTGGTDVHNVDAITGATVTVMVVNETLMRSALKVGQALGLAGLSAADQAPPATIKRELFTEADWPTLTGDGSIRRLRLSRGQVDEAFAGTRAAKGQGEGRGQHKDELFIDLYYAPLNVPTIGRNLLGDDQYDWLMADLQPGDQAIAVFGKGRYSFKGNGYVRGGIFDRTQLQQDGKTILFHDSDYHRLSDVYIDGFPGFDEMMIFIIRDHYQFDPGAPWQLELVVRRQIGALDSVFTSFYGDYQIPEVYIDRPAPPVVEAPESEPLWVSIWREKAFQIGVLSVSLVLLTTIIFLQDALVRYPRLLHNLRHLFLAYTVVFIGWYALGQLSVVNVFTFVHAVMSDFHWQLFLLDPVIFILWAYTAMTLILWGRGIFCGWLCPFGALQELLNQLARKLKIRQFEPPFAVHQRLWALKYIILLVLFAISLESLSEAERYAEVEPFKTAIMLKFQREWGYVLYAGLLLFISLFTRKVYCRYVCPLGAALVIPSKFRIFDWLRRRKECGNPCKVCANECEIQAIEPDGHINANECHYCLDCQMTYFNEQKCPPLVAKARKRRKQAGTDDTDRIPAVEVR